MTNSKAVNIALCMHLLCIVFGYTVFLEAEDCHSTWTRFASYVMLGSCVLYLHDIETFPGRYLRRSANLEWIFFTIETIISLLAIEVFMLFFWLKLELAIVLTLKACLGDVKSQMATKIVSCVVTILSLISFFYAAYVTNRLNRIIDYARIVFNGAQSFIKYLFTRTPAAPVNNGMQRLGTHCAIIPCETLGIDPQTICNSVASVAAAMPGPSGDDTVTPARSRLRSNTPCTPATTVRHRTSSSSSSTSRGRGGRGRSAKRATSQTSANRARNARSKQRCK